MRTHTENIEGVVVSKYPPNSSMVRMTQLISLNKTECIKYYIRCFQKVNTYKEYCTIRQSVSNSTARLFRYTDLITEYT